MVGSAGAAYAGIPAVNSVQNVQQDETCTGMVWHYLKVLLIHLRVV